MRQRRVSETGETWEQALQRTARDADERQKAEREVEACPGGGREEQCTESIALDTAFTYITRDEI